ncbi:glycosyltransferase family 4 protein [Aerococcus urinaeequi]|uniref:Glycosyltransferase family 4 protein n=1 Tax=Aerococcus urinaeequi TaxID=51665 RepID=A0AA47G9U4_9LACT|nr:glycosyltransferase family 4 protein [Aerococcus urinaeequi]WAT23984.1 glycosyltransferase family 4 protein [Aerococcus urinaeequi]
MIKILFLVSSLKKSGPTIQTLNLIRMLNFDIYDVSLITLSENPKENLMEDFRKLNIKITEIPLKRTEITYRKVYRAIENYNPDIIHSSGIRADKIASKSSIKTISTIHNFMFMDYPFRYGKLLGNMMVKKHLNYLKSIDLPIACSKSIAQQYYDRNGNNFYSIPNGVDTDQYDEVSKSAKQLLRKKLNLPLDKKIFISTGHLSQLKDPRVIIEGFSKAMDTEDSILVFLGDGPLKDELEAINANNVYFVGRTKLVAEYLRAADVFISASHTEGLPNSVMEALSTNLPAILSNIPPHNELYVDEEMDILFFEVGNYNELSTKIERIYDFIDNKKILNRKYIEKYFSANVMGTNYMNAYEELLNSIGRR